MVLTGSGPLSELISTAVCLVGMLLPGLFVAGLLAERLELDVAEAATVAFASTLAIGAAAASLAYWIGTALPFVSAVLVGACVASVWWIVRTVRRRSMPFTAVGWPGLALAGAAALLSLTQGQSLSGSSDAFYHLSAIRALVHDGQTLVTDPFFGTAIRALDPTSGAWHSVAAAWSKLLGLDVLGLWPGLTAVGALVIVAGTWSVMRRATGNRWAAFAATVAYFATVWAFDFRPAAFPKHVTTALAAAALVLLVRAVKQRSIPAGLAAAVTAYGAASAHLGAAELLAIGWTSVLVWGVIAALIARRRGATGQGRGLAVAALAGVPPALLLAPMMMARMGVLASEKFFAGPTTLHTFPVNVGSVTLLAVDPSILPGGLALNVLAAAAAVAALLTLLQHDDGGAFVVLALATIPLTVVADPVISSVMKHWSTYVTARTVELLPWAPFTALAWLLGRRRKGWREVGFAASAVAVLFALVAAAPLWRSTWVDDVRDTSSLAFSRALDMRTTWGADTIRDLQNVFGPDWPVVGGHPNTAYEMAGIAPVHAYSVPRGNTPAYFAAHDADTRRAEMYAMMRPQLTEAVRRQLATSCGLDFVVVDTRHIEGLKPAATAMAADPGAFRLVYIGRGLYVFRVLTPPSN